MDNKEDTKDEDEIVTLNEFLQSEEAAENEISCVISASDPKNCSYDQGYVARQAVFVCLSCVKEDSSQRGGVCLACSLTCHEGHEQLVLYTKRRFRCDCGNGKFPDSFVCRRQPGKEAANEKNVYGHNFAGLYCTCERPYPDPEDDVEDEMVQCCVCEDWFHSRHLSPPLESTDEHYELICQGCVEKFPFLSGVVPKVDSDGSGATVSSAEVGPETDGSPPNKRARPAPVCLSSVKPSADPHCILITDDGWRSTLCRCQDCQALLTESGLLFLLDVDDSVGRYEARGRERKEQAETSTVEQVAELWNNMGRVRQVEVGSRLNSFKSQLQDFFAKSASEGKVVTTEAVGEFFKSLLAQDPGYSVVKSCSFRP